MSEGASAEPEVGVTLVGPSYPFRGGIAQYTTMLFNALAETCQVSLVGFTRQCVSSAHLGQLMGN